MLTEVSGFCGQNAQCHQDQQGYPPIAHEINLCSNTQVSYKRNSQDTGTSKRDNVLQYLTVLTLNVLLDELEDAGLNLLTTLAVSESNMDFRHREP